MTTAQRSTSAPPWPPPGGFSQRTIAAFDGTPLGVQVVEPDAPSTSPPPVLLLANGLGARMGAYRFIIDRFRPYFRFVSWDYRGTYSSARPVRGYASLGVRHHADDARAILDAIGAQEVHALGWSMGVQVLLELCRADGDRVRSLVLHNGVPGRPYLSVGGRRAGQLLEPVVPRVLTFGQGMSGLVEKAVRRVVDWDEFIPLTMRLGLVHKDLDREVFAETARAFVHLDMHLYIELLKQLGEHDARDVLSTIRCPALVAQGTHDQMTPLEVARDMAAAMQNATLELLPGGTHYAAVEMAPLMNQLLDRFWRNAGVLDDAGRAAAAGGR